MNLISFYYKGVAKISMLQCDCHDFQCKVNIFLIDLQDYYLSIEL